MTLEKHSSLLFKIYCTLTLLAALALVKVTAVGSGSFTAAIPATLASGLYNGTAWD